MSVVRACGVGSRLWCLHAAAFRPLTLLLFAVAHASSGWQSPPSPYTCTVACASSGQPREVVAAQPARGPTSPGGFPGSCRLSLRCSSAVVQAAIATSFCPRHRLPWPRQALRVPGPGPGRRMGAAVLAAAANARGGKPACGPRAGCCLSLRCPLLGGQGIRRAVGAGRSAAGVRPSTACPASAASTSPQPASRPAALSCKPPPIRRG